MDTKTKVEMKDVSTETNRPIGAVIIQKEKEKKKQKKVEKRKIKSIPNAVPSQEQQFRIFQNIDYPYMMRNVAIQDEEDKMVKALREVFGIKEKTPEMVAEEALQKSVIKGRSYPLYTDEELTQQEKRARAINTSDSLRRLAGVSGLFDDSDMEAPRAFNASVDKYMSYLADFRKQYWGEEAEAGAKTIKPSGELSQEQLQAKMSAFNPERQPYKEPSKAGRPRKPVRVLELGSSLEGAKTRQEIPSFITSEAELESLIGVMESTGIDKKREQTNKIARTIQEALRNKIASDRFKEALQAQARREQFQLDLFAKEEERRIQDIKSEFRKRDIQKTFSEMFGDF